MLSLTQEKNFPRILFLVSQMLIYKSLERKTHQSRRDLARLCGRTLLETAVDVTKMNPQWLGLIVITAGQRMLD